MPCSASRFPSSLTWFLRPLCTAGLPPDSCHSSASAAPGWAPGCLGLHLLQDRGHPWQAEPGAELCEDTDLQTLRFLQPWPGCQVCRKWLQAGLQETGGAGLGGHRCSLFWGSFWKSLMCPPSCLLGRLPPQPGSGHLWGAEAQRHSGQVDVMGKRSLPQQCSQLDC